MKKVILAYSGGLDTSCCIKWLKEKGYDVVTFSADLGQGIDFEALKKRAIATGASKAYVKDLKEEFAREFILPALKANAIYESGYLLATALGRPLIAKHLVEVAEKEMAEFVAHGCTGKGNDQVRFEVAINILAPELRVIAPVREWELKSREAEIAYARKHNIPVEATKESPYSIDRNLWGVSIECGELEDPWQEPAKEVYQITKDLDQTPAKPRYLQIFFEKGVPRKLDDRSLDLVKLVARLNEIGGRYGVGRSDMVENRLVGIKSREVYEAPAATILHLAHKGLEALVFDRELAHFKEGLSLKYAELIYNGLWYSPLKRSLDAFFDESQKRVTGTVKLKLYKGKCEVVGRKSKYSLYKKELATYGKEDKFDQKAAEGFIKIWGLPYHKR